MSFDSPVIKITRLTLPPIKIHVILYNKSIIRATDKSNLEEVFLLVYNKYLTGLVSYCPEKLGDNTKKSIYPNHIL